MRSRLAPLIVLALTLGLGAFAAYVWFGPGYRVRFEGKNLHLGVVVSTRKPADPELWVSFHNRGKYALMVLESPDLRGPFEVRLVPEGGGAPPGRLPPGTGGRPAVARRLGSRQECSWTVPLSRLYGKLPPGSYLLTLVYDTAAGDEPVEEVDLGRVQADPVRFEIKAEK